MITKHINSGDNEHTRAKMSTPWKKLMITKHIDGGDNEHTLAENR